MSTVQPPPPSPALPAATPAVAPPVLTVLNPPPALSTLALGTSLAALVSGAAVKGSAEIETPLGKFLAETRLALKSGQPLLLQVAQNPGKGTFVFNVLEIAGKPTLPGTQATLSGSAGLQGFAASTVPAGVASPILAPTTSISLLIGSTLTATTLTAISVHPAAQAGPGGPQASSPGALLPPQPTMATSPTPTPSLAMSIQGSQSGQRPGLLVPGIGSIESGGTGVSNANPARIFSIGSQFSLTIQTVSPATTLPSRGSPAIAPSVPASAFVVGAVAAGRVTAHTLSGQPIVQINHGSVALGTTQSIPIGTELAFKIEALPELGDASRPLSPALQRIGMMISRSWPSLDEGLSTLQSADPSLAQQLLSVAIPKANIKLAATTLFFLSALRGGDIRGWIGGNATRLLERLRPDVMRRLGTDFRNLGDTEEGGRVSRATNWRGTLVPFFDGNAIEYIRLFTRQHGGDDDDDDEPEERGTRFLVDITLTNIGRFQLDGIAETGERRLDMIVRTSSALPNRVRSDLMKLFSDANEIVGMRGGMVFQASPESFVEPIEEIPQESGVGIVV